MRGMTPPRHLPRESGVVCGESKVKLFVGHHPKPPRMPPTRRRRVRRAVIATGVLALGAVAAGAIATRQLRRVHQRPAAWDSSPQSDLARFRLEQRMRQRAKADRDLDWALARVARNERRQMMRINGGYTAYLSQWRTARLRKKLPGLP